MKTFSFFILLTASCCFGAAAQQTDSTKLFNHYIGIQANQLLKQLINLNNNNVAISNPYLLTYSLFSSKYNWGIETGFGYNYKRSKDKLTAADQESKISESFYRFGIVKKFSIGKKWETSIGIDYAGSYQLDKTFAFTVTDFGTQKDSTASVSTSITKSKGGGIQMRLVFNISTHILLGTETTFYYETTNKKSNVIVSDTFTRTDFPELNTYTLSASNTETEEAAFNITLPVAIFLTVKF